MWYTSEYSSCDWELASTLLDKLGADQVFKEFVLGISFYPS
ncbi:hypothetical protein BIFDEN_01943 [Bifidobacterium dentium ATCC 27678]|nr:hypothetical protein BIFDEN_01943 [Bifidobacterium dentium ATCC 27678]